MLLPVLSGIMFGSAGVFVRTLSAYGMSGPTILFVRVAGALAAMTVLLLVTDRRRFRTALRDLPLFAGTGLVGMLGLNLCYNEAVGRITLSLAAVLLSTSPVFVVILAAVLFGERITWRKMGCMVLAMAGCVLASGLLEQGSGGQGVSLSGVLLGLASALFYALYSIFSRKAMDRSYHTYTIVFYSVLLITLVLLPFAEYERIGAFLAERTAARLGFLAIHTLCTSVLPYVFLTLALLHAEAGKVSILAAGGEPIAAVIFGGLFFVEVPTALMLLGIAVTVAALALLCKRPKAAGDAAQGQEPSS